MSLYEFETSATVRVTLDTTSLKVTAVVMSDIVIPPEVLNDYEASRLLADAFDGTAMTLRAGSVDREDHDHGPWCVTDCPIKEAARTMPPLETDPDWAGPVRWQQ
jgi:hypothetical protein